MLLAFGAIGLGIAVGRRSGLRSGVDATTWLWRTVLVGLVAARLAYVWQWHDAYLRDPLGILDVRDGGWDVAIGAAAAFVYASTLVRRRPQAKRPLLAAGIVTATIGVIGTIVLAFWPGSQQAPRIPALELRALDGRSVALQQFTDRPLVLNLWATWCGPCRREMPVLQQAQASHPDVRFVFLNQGETAAQVERFLHAENLVLDNVLLDPWQEAGKSFGRVALPTTLFFDSNGRLVSSRVGELSEATLEQRLRHQAAAEARIRAQR
ncbi:MAG: TlpA family protein disulfide reductase [Limnobacter sp.]|nr:TlpA family protein disulfide reductase [Limnobacter sp.]